MTTRHRGRMSMLLIIAIAAGHLAAQTTAPEDTLALQPLKNTTYSGIEQPGTPIALVNGRWEDAARRIAVSFAGDLRAVGDLDGDGASEAAVLVAESDVAGGERIYLAVFRAISGRAVNVATEMIGSNVKVRRLRVANRVIALDLVQAGAGDALCCPSELVTRRFELQGTTLVERPAAHTGTLSPQVMGGTDWILRNWTFDETAPTEPRITLRFEVGQFVGNGGCNRYSATVRAAGDGPGQIIVSAPLSTRMACPGVDMSVESRFMRLLQAVDAFTFSAGRLALDYAADNARDVMLFDAAP